MGNGSNHLSQAVTWVGTKWAFPHGGPRGVRSSILKCYVTNFAPHKDLKFIVFGKLTFDEKSVVHGVDDRYMEILGMQLTAHERGRLDQCLHVARDRCCPDREKEGRSKSETSINTNIASVSLTWRVGAFVLP
jgi:hypothetical protein